APLQLHADGADDRHVLRLHSVRRARAAPAGASAVSGRDDDSGRAHGRRYHRGRNRADGLVRAAREPHARSVDERAARERREGAQLMKHFRFLACGVFASMAAAAHASGVEGPVPAHVALNPVAIGMFLLFVCVTLGITRWASRRTRTTKDFYSAGGG